MIKTILIWTGILVIIGLLVIWLIQGGWSATANIVRNFTNPVDIIFGNGTTTGVLIHLPWEKDSVRGPDIGGYAGEADRINGGASGDEQMAVAPRAEDIGTRSLYATEVTLDNGDATAEDPPLEYLEISASGNNAEPISITGWSLQSAASGARVYISGGTPVFVAGTVNKMQPIYLEPGASAIVMSGPSPTGISFRENICTGYLEQSQNFTPELESSCPYASEMLPETGDNIRKYGAACFDFLKSVQRCNSPSSIPSDLSAACRSFAGSAFTYNGCVSGYKTSPGFPLTVWRIFLNQNRELWGNSHDVIRLLDREGRTVDVLTY